MVYFEEGNFKRYVKEIKDTSKNSKTGFREVQQLNITGLSKNSKFKDGQKVIIIGNEEFKKHLEDYQNKETKVNELTQKLQEAKITITELEGKLDQTPQTQKDNNKIIELYERLDQKQTVIDNHKNIIIQANDKVNNLMEELTSEITNYCNEGVSQANLSTQTRIINLLSQIKDINNTNVLLMEDLQGQVKEYNNSNFVKRWFKKINIDFDKMEDNKKLLEEFNSIDIEDTAKNITKSFTIDRKEINTIKNNIKSKKLDFKGVFLIDNGNSQDDKEININGTEDHLKDN